METQQEATQHEQADTGLTDQIDGSDSGTTGEALGADGETFFDPTDIADPALQAQYKQMQASYTRKMQELSQQNQSVRDKVEQYDSFMQDPVNTIQRLAAQYGLNVSRGQAQQMADQQDSDPKNWQDVYAKAAQTAEAKLMEKLSPILKDVQQTKKTQLETMLDQQVPDWRDYEPKMIELLGKYPEMANDPMHLYRLAVPEKVLNERATKAALKRLKQTAESGQLSGGNTNASASKATPKVESFEDAVMVAKQRMGNKGR